MPANWASWTRMPPRSRRMAEARASGSRAAMPARPLVKGSSSRGRKRRPWVSVHDRLIRTANIAQ